jgi:hypothetical protein
MMFYMHLTCTVSVMSRICTSVIQQQQSPTATTTAPRKGWRGSLNGTNSSSSTYFNVRRVAATQSQVLDIK